MNIFLNREQKQSWLSLYFTNRVVEDADAFQAAGPGGVGGRVGAVEVPGHHGTHF